MVAVSVAMAGGGGRDGNMLRAVTYIAQAIRTMAVRRSAISRCCGTVLERTAYPNTNPVAGAG